MYNNVIHNFLTHQNNPAKELKKIRETHKNVAMVNSLLVFQMVRQPQPSNRKERKEIEDLLLNLENQCLEGTHSCRSDQMSSIDNNFSLQMPRKVKRQRRILCGRCSIFCRGKLFESSRSDGESFHRKKE